ncbi:MAG TPA: glycosyltransferase family 4 protein [Longimicrobiales bacterium]
MGALLVLFHCRSNTGYAIGRLERVFLEMALNVFGSPERIHFAYPAIERGLDPALRGRVKNVVAFDYRDGSPASVHAITEYIGEHDIRVIFGFDQPVTAPTYKALRKAGVELFISYWGAPMSSINHGIRLLAKRVQFAITRYKPDLFIFESEAMRETAVAGRGVPHSATRVVYNGVDEKRFRPAEDRSYAYDLFGIPADRKIVYYSGHMEERKGVHVIVEAAVDLVTRRGRKDVHFLFMGNKNGEERRFDPLYMDTEAADHITFGGYHDEVERIIPCCHIGAIATTGWDSFPLSPLEMQSCGLPVIASALQGLKECVEDGVTGFLVEPGDPLALSRRIEELLRSPDLRARMSVAARKRIVNGFTAERQIGRLSEVLREAVLRSRGGTRIP